MNGPPLIALQKVSKSFIAGDGVVSALRDVDIEITSGEYVAIMGASGSGKSTLLNILGCLDRPSAGSYRIDDQSVEEFTPEALADLRRERFGFVFQRYHLLPALTALENTELPTIYSGMTRSDRRSRALSLLKRLGLSERLDHRPHQLSGGQQQRVSISRALVNGADIILADEPTGALDRQSGEEVLRIFEALNSDGRTIIIVTHDPDVAARAKRQIKLDDGAVIEDSGSSVVRFERPSPCDCRDPGRGRGIAPQMLEAARMALKAVRAHRLRSALTILGIAIGIASVVSILGLAQVARDKILADISALGTNTLEIFPGKELGDVRSSKIRTLVLSDARALEGLPSVAGATPTLTLNTTARGNGAEANALINGVGEQYFAIKGAKLSAGRFFGHEDIASLTQVAVIDDVARRTFFPGDRERGLGKTLLIGKVPTRVVGVMAQQQSGLGSTQNPAIYVPYSTAAARIVGTTSLRSIIVRVRDPHLPKAVEAQVEDLLTLRHRSKDFVILNTDDILKTVSNVTATLSIMIASIAGISLLVGGIGVMNIMLVAVSERTSEIGLRMAVGARSIDVLRQFLLEAACVCQIGGVLGAAGALLVQVAFNAFAHAYTMQLAITSLLGALVFSIAVGLVFGYAPARRAARLTPLQALARD